MYDLNFEYRINKAEHAVQSYAAGIGGQGVREPGAGPRG